MVSPKFILGLLIFIIGFHTVAVINHWYWTYPWFDMPMHFLGGFWLAMFYFWLNSKFNIVKIQTPNINRNFWRSDFPKSILVLGFVALIGVLWEFIEFLYYIFIFKNGYFFFWGTPLATVVNSYDVYRDTLGDLFFDLVGGLVFFVIQKFKFQQNKVGGSE
jgi:hypothetical protein